MRKNRLMLLLILTICTFSCEKREAPKENAMNHSEDIIKKAFIEEGWKKANYRNRAAYIDDLLGRKVLIGKTKDQVVEMLGSYDNSFNEDNSISYRLKIYSDAGSDYDHVLYIVFNADNIAVSAIVTD